MEECFDDLESLWNYAKKEIKKTMKNEVVEKMKDVEQEVIQEVVLNAYDSSYYDRRSESTDGREGLISRDNMKPTYIDKKDGISIEMTNDTRGNTNYPNSTNDFIDEIVESGQGYTWKSSEIYKNQQARPFTKETQERLDSSDIIEKTIIRNSKFEIK